MYQDVLDLATFYHSPLGHLAARMIRRQVRRLWPDMRGAAMLGIGFATPFLAPFQGEAERLLAAMPAPQGVAPWPEEGPGRVTLTDPDRLPFPDYSFDRVVVAHGLEFTEDRAGLLQEVWRVLASGGRLLMVVPNRRGIWARVDRTPFGWGHPYSPSQLSRLLRDHMFTPVRTEQALFIPPTRSNTLLRSAAAVERLGRRWCPTFSGVVMIEAGKQLYAATPVRQRSRFRRPVVVRFPQVAGRSSRDGLRREPLDDEGQEPA